MASQYFRATVSQIGNFRGPIVSVTKGIEFQSGLTMSGILEDILPHCPAVALSGPSLAAEVARGVPTAVVAAGRSQEMARLVQDVFHSPTFRVYTGSDILGVELGGALKNIIAIAAGICDGIGFGSNSKAALMTRAIVEIRRLGVAMGAEADTFSGLSGLGDLMVTCFSPLSRNHSVGERLGKGEKLNEILVSMALWLKEFRQLPQLTLSERFQVETPIMNEFTLSSTRAKRSRSIICANRSEPKGRIERFQVSICEVLQDLSISRAASGDFKENRKSLSHPN